MKILILLVVLLGAVYYTRAAMSGLCECLDPGSQSCKSHSKCYVECDYEVCSDITEKKGRCVSTTACDHAAAGFPSGEMVSAKFNNLQLFITWSNNFTAIATLNDDMKEDCIYTGDFDKDPGSDVLLTGCSADDLSVQFESFKFGDEFFSIKDREIVYLEPEEDYYNEEIYFENPYKPTPQTENNGRVRRNDDYYFDPDIVNPYKPTLQIRPESNGRVRRNDDHYYYFDPDIVNEYSEYLPDLDDYEVVFEDIPEQFEMQLNIYLDTDFVKKFRSEKRAKRTAKQILKHTEKIMKHKSLKSSILLDHGNRIYLSNTHLVFQPNTVHTDLLLTLPKLLKEPFAIDDYPVAHVYLTASNSPRGMTGVAASGGSICNPLTDRYRPAAIVKYNRGAQGTGLTLAHELGHVLGMFHDFSKHGDRVEEKCGENYGDGTVLNYGNNPKREFWSSCSNEDFKNYFLKMKFSEQEQFCLRVPESACTKSQFRCNTGLCIELSQRCDFSKRDCPGGEDEANCPFKGLDVCLATEWECKTGPFKCIPKYQRCDGMRRNCPDGSDERNCPFVPFSF